MFKKHSEDILKISSKYLPNVFWICLDMRAMRDSVNYFYILVFTENRKDIYLQCSCRFLYLQIVKIEFYDKKTNNCQKRMCEYFLNVFKNIF